MKSQQTKKILIFVPGLYGTRLVDQKTKKTVWATAHEVLLGKKTLALKVAGLESDEFLDLEIGEVLDEVKVVPGLYHEQAYAKTMRRMKKWALELGMQFDSVGFDWRRDILSSIENIHQRVEFWRNQGFSVSIVAHSMGAFLMSYYLRYGLQDPLHAEENWFGLEHLDRLVMAAAPFRGSLVLLRNMNFGVSRGLNKNLLSGSAYSTFEGIYSLLPLTGLDHVWIYEGQAQMELGQLNLADVRTWQETRSGLFRERLKFHVTDRGELERFTHHWLQKGRAFQEKILAPPFPSNDEGSSKQNEFSAEILRDRVMYFWGEGFKTIERGVYVKSKKRVIYWPHDLKRDAPEVYRKHGKGIVFVDGDQTVSSETSRPLESLLKLGAHLVQRKAEHLALIEDKQSQQEMKMFFSRQR